jgi:hypothetical protein
MSQTILYVCQMVKYIPIMDYNQEKILSINKKENKLEKCTTVKQPISFSIKMTVEEYLSHDSI